MYQILYILYDAVYLWNLEKITYIAFSEPSFHSAEHRQQFILVISDSEFKVESIISDFL